MKQQKSPPKGATKRVSSKKASKAKKSRNELTPKQAAFVREYLVDLNAAQAATRVGYSAKTANVQASRLLTNAYVRAAVDAGIAARAKRTEVTADRVLEQLGRMVFFDIRTLFDADGSLKPIHELSDDAAAALVSVDTDEIHEGTGKDRKFVGYSKKVRIADRVGTIQLAMRHLKMLTDKVALGGDEDNPAPIPVATTAGAYDALRAKMSKFAGAPT
ncbi:MAG: terminase small subunit [Casimicrobium sp.]